MRKNSEAPMPYSTYGTTTPSVDNSVSNNTTPKPATTTPAIKPVSHNVTIQNMAFSPSSLTIKKGEMVVWTNKDSVPHTVVANDGGSKSSTLNPGQSYAFTFNNAGSFAYHCGIHPSMKGTVVITQ
ncbi:MAG: cupredoxin family copper-binding protein [Patescibacteria group bacterium]|nr:cupredoxin family copper-binding protein [Patescibacteria group bacterium]